MCGILGILGDLPSQPTIEKARDSMTHRGPDDFGMYYNEKEHIALGHRRLAIIDLSPAGKNPFFSQDARFVMVFNGEIFNYQEIKKELEGFYHFQTQTDTEVLLAAFLKWGPACLHKFNGMFAFAIWDREREELFVARDRLGVKPLYYHVSPQGTFYFASEIKGILAFDPIPRRLDLEGFSDYLSYRYPLGNKTLFQGIHSLLPGHYAVVQRGKTVNPTPWWELSTALKEDPGEEEALRKTEALLKQAVRYRMISDVPVGAFLSGGLDSSLLVALMAESSAEPIKTFSVGFDEDGYSELEQARHVAERFKTDHHEYIITGQQYFELSHELIRYKDAPLATQNEAALFFLSQKVKKDATVLLGGDGADELFAGYGRIFRSAEDWLKWRERDDLDMSERDREIFVSNLKKKYTDLEHKELIDHFLGQYSYFNLSQKSRLLNAAIFKKERSGLLNRSYFSSHFSRLGTLHPIDQYLYVFQLVHLLGPLQRLDTPTMAASVEARVPYVDYQLVEYVSSLPHHYKMRWKSEQDQRAASVLNADQISEKHDRTKYLLRKIAEKHLPISILQRKKMGFPAPLDQWFQGELNSVAKETLLSTSARSYGLYDRKALEQWMNERPITEGERKGMNIWMLVNLELWMKEYHVTL